MVEEQAKDASMAYVMRKFFEASAAREAEKNVPSMHRIVGSNCDLTQRESDCPGRKLAPGGTSILTYVTIASLGPLFRTVTSHAIVCPRPTVEGPVCEILKSAMLGREETEESVEETDELLRALEEESQTTIFSRSVTLFGP